MFDDGLGPSLNALGDLDPRFDTDAALDEALNLSVDLRDEILSEDTPIRNYAEYLRGRAITAMHDFALDTDPANAAEVQRRQADMAAYFNFIEWVNETFNVGTEIYRQKQIERRENAETQSDLGDSYDD